MLLNKLPTSVIFDFDNTLVATLPAIHAAFNDTLEFYGLKKWTSEELLNNIKFSPREYLPKIVGVDKAKDAADYYLEAYQKRSNNLIKPIDKAVELIEHLLAQQIPLFIVSNKRGKLLRREVLDLLGWEKYFQKIVGSEDCAHDKPHPSVVEYALGQKPNKSVWFIGDSDVDITCALNSGCLAILINGDKNLKLEHQPDFQYSCLDSFLAEIRNLQNV